ncbi:hypothetical protein [Marivirga atlantica]|uniref:Uncharacterized protein n=1 Tax=Marivirga atlantica TaxID=1548457 RepID=A0A937A5D6_9BACT|nr:hypothetical protein [Marivirga atlantica]MBL0763900.1 hypothetical protein [Marivirga atlantica]
MGKTKAITEIVDKLGSKKLIYTTYFNKLANQFFEEVSEKAVHLKSEADHLFDLINSNILEQCKERYFQGHPRLNAKVNKVLRIKQLNILEDSSILSEDANWIFRYIRDYVKLDTEGRNYLFPLSRFTEGEDKVLVASIQKLLKSTYDGKSLHSLMTLKDHIIVIDEFDYTFRTVLKHITNERELNNLLVFLEDFMNWHKKTDHGIERLKKVYDTFKKDLDFNKIEFPKRHYFIKAKTKNNLQAAFHSNKEFLKKGFFIEQPKDTDYFLLSENKDGIYSNVFFRIFIRVLTNIQSAFRVILDREGENYYNFLINDIWSSHNDDTPGRIYHFLSSTTPYLFRVQKSRKDTDLNRFYTGTLNFIEQNSTDLLVSNKVSINHSQLISTPENIIDQLSRKNLVFGVSATIQIPRNVNHYDVAALMKQNYFIDWSPDYKSVIKSKILEKAEERQTQITFKSLLNNKTDTLQNEMKIIKHDGFLNSEGGYDSINAIENRFDRTLRFLKYFQYVVKDSISKTHLVYASTFSQIKNLFAEENAARYTEIHSRWNVKHFKIHQEIDVEDKTLNLFFFDKSTSHLMSAKNKDYQAIFNNGNHATIVLTQFASASNGINPVCWNGNKKTDFEAIAILEKDYFGFSAIERNSKDRFKERSIKKENFYLLVKMLFNKEIDYKTYFSNLNQGLNRLNSMYLKSDEYTLYMASLIIQVLGRQDRQWKYTPHCEVILWDDVRDVYSTFLTDEKYQNHTSLRERASFKSDYFEKLDNIIAKNSTVSKIKKALSSEDIGNSTEALKREIGLLLKRLAIYRNSSEDDKGAEENPWHEWIQLREDALIQKPVKLDNAIIKTRLLKDGLIFKKGKEILPEQTEDCLRINYKYPFELIVKNKVVKNYFYNHGYEVELRTSQYEEQKIWNPLFFQAIVCGAIGEEAVKAIMYSEGFEVEHIKDRQLVELADFRIEDNFIDAKLYGEGSLNELFFSGKDLLTSAIEKLKTIRKVCPSARYYIVNYTYDENIFSYETTGFSLNGKKVNLNVAEIFICPGITNPITGDIISKKLDELKTSFYK